MRKVMAAWIFLAVLSAFALPTIAEVLIVADEFPAMEVLARRLKAEDGVETRLIRQPQLPVNLAPFQAVVVYIHGQLAESVERACVGYATNGGRLVLLHHSISSGKRRNPEWLPFLGVELPEGDPAHGGYQWIEGVTAEWVNLTGDHYVMTNRVTYPGSTPYRSQPGGDLIPRPSITLSDTEVYLNHQLKGRRTILMGLKYHDSKTDATHMESTAGWCRPAGKGWVIYLMPGHSVRDFENAAYGRIVLNAITAPASALR